jgi:Cytochrome P460
MRPIVLVLAGALALPALPWPVQAGPEKVAFPEGYPTRFVRYATADKPEREPPIVRFLYVNQEALAAAKAGEPLPHGTVAVMEDHPAALGGDGKPLTDGHGRFVPTAEITNVFVQEKRAGWGEEYPEAKRNGEWEYAWFEPDGARKTGEKVNFDRCFECHKGVADQDFTFTLQPFVTGVKQ